MKKGMAVLLALPFLLGCGIKTVKPTEFSCEFPRAYERICYDELECDEYMQWYGQQIAEKMAEGKNGLETGVDVNLFSELQQLSRIGKVWAEVTKEGLYVCESYIFCDVQGQKVGEFKECALIRAEEE